MNRGTAFLFEIHGEEGDFQLTATSPASMQRQKLNVKGARGDDEGIGQSWPSPDKYRWVPAGFLSPCCGDTSLISTDLDCNHAWFSPFQRPGLEAGVKRRVCKRSVQPEYPPLVASRETQALVNNGVAGVAGQLDELQHCAVGIVK